MNSNNFCPAPWMSLFVQGNTTSVCCADNNKLNLSPLEFRSSEHLKNIKKQFLAGEKPSNCSHCWNQESEGLQSIRQHYNDDNPQYSDLNSFTIETELPVEHIELRTSNLCNYSCRMCNAKNSVEIKREIDRNPSLSTWFVNVDDSTMKDQNLQEVFDSIHTLNRLFLTGGEPLLMKEYYDLMDYAISIGRNEKMELIVYTNVSVYNPKFIEKLLKFDKVNLNLSIDGVGKTAEYQRKGTDWNTVYKNAIIFVNLPVKTTIHSTITAYTLLDFSSLADFYNEMLHINNNIYFMAHPISSPKALNFLNLNGDLRSKAIDEITKSIYKLNDKKFSQINIQLENILKALKTDTQQNYTEFVEFTKSLDISRNERFEDVFGYKLY